MVVAPFSYSVEFPFERAIIRLWCRDWNRKSGSRQFGTPWIATGPTETGPDRKRIVSNETRTEKKLHFGNKTEKKKTKKPIKSWTETRNRNSISNIATETVWNPLNCNRTNWNRAGPKQHCTEPKPGPKKKICTLGPKPKKRWKIQLRAGPKTETEKFFRLFFGFNLYYGGCVSAKSEREDEQPS